MQLGGRQEADVACMPAWSAILFWCHRVYVVSALCSRIYIFLAVHNVTAVGLPAYAGCITGDNLCNLLTVIGVYIRHIHRVWECDIISGPMM